MGCKRRWGELSGLSDYVVSREVIEYGRGSNEKLYDTVYLGGK